MPKINIKEFVKPNEILTTMMTYHQIVAILENLQTVLDANIPGDIVELGCNQGTTSVYIRRLLDAYNSDKEFHVYDSWEGLPEKHVKDTHGGTRHYVKGNCKTSKESFVENFEKEGLKLPVIHSGWFAEIPDEEYPDQICFAFYDGDFYTSIIDSFNKTYHKMSKGGIIMIDDCGFHLLPGVERACNDFLQDKEEQLDLTGYPNANGVYGGIHGGGKIVKLS